MTRVRTHLDIVSQYLCDLKDLRNIYGGIFLLSNIFGQFSPFPFKIPFYWNKELALKP